LNIKTLFKNDMSTNESNTPSQPNGKKARKSGLPTTKADMDAMAAFLELEFSGARGPGEPLKSNFSVLISVNASNGKGLGAGKINLHQSMAEFVNKARANAYERLGKRVEEGSDWTAVSSKTRFDYIYKSFKELKAELGSTGGGITQKERAKGITTIEQKTKARCYLYDVFLRLDTGTNYNKETLVEVGDRAPPPHVSSADVSRIVDDYGNMNLEELNEYIDFPDENTAPPSAESSQDSPECVPKRSIDSPSVRDFGRRRKNGIMGTAFFVRTC